MERTLRRRQGGASWWGGTSMEATEETEEMEEMETENGVEDWNKTKISASEDFHCSHDFNIKSHPTR